MPLTSVAIENTKPRTKPYTIADGDGLYLLVKPNGRKLWRLRYRYAGKQNMLSLGSFPTLLLAGARGKRDAAHKLLADGIDPSQQRKLDQIARATAARNTFGELVEEYLEILRESGAAESTLNKNRWLLQDLARSEEHTSELRSR